jgi:calcineurin-like phosphoesterase family protein
MSRIWLISDTHFMHHNIAKYCDRPENHNELMWENLEERVTKDDLLIHLGDVGWHGGPGNRNQERDIVDRLPGGRKILVVGNHDHRRVRNYKAWDHVVQKESQPFVLDVDGFQVYMAHRPETVGVMPESLVIHGHIHEKGVPERWHGTCKIINACVEQWNYCPLDVRELIDVYLLERRSHGEAEEKTLLD